MVFVFSEADLTKVLNFDASTDDNGVCALTVIATNKKSKQILRINFNIQKLVYRDRLQFFLLQK